MKAQRAPVSRTEVAPRVPDLSSLAVRRELSPHAIKGFMNIMDAWQIPALDARHLLGGVSNGRYYELRKNPDKILGQDALMRVSLLVGIFKALNILHEPKLADAWVSLPNANRIFGGATPLEFMIRGGVPAMLTVRRLLDARRGGLA